MIITQTMGTKNSNMISTGVLLQNLDCDILHIALQRIPLIKRQKKIKQHQCPEEVLTDGINKT